MTAIILDYHRGECDVIHGIPSAMSIDEVEELIHRNYNMDDIVWMFNPDKDETPMNAIDYNDLDKDYTDFEDDPRLTAKQKEELYGRDN